MKKRVLALLAALSLLLGLLPTGAMAAGESAQTGDVLPLHLYWVGHWPEGSRGEKVGDNGEGISFADWGDNWGILLYTDEAGTEPVPADASVTYVADSGTTENALVITAHEPGFWNLAFNAIGSGVIRAVVNGVTYEHGLVSRLPHDGLCSAPTLTEATYIPRGEGWYSDSDRTFYYVFDEAAYNGSTIRLISNAGALDVSASGKVFTFTVPAGHKADMELDLIFEVFNDYLGTSYHRYAEVNLRYSGRVVVAKSDYRDYGTVYEMVDSDFNTGIRMQPGYETGRVFYIRENGSVSLATGYTVSSSDESVMTVDRLGNAVNTGHPVWRIRSVGFGSAQVLLTFADGEVLTYPVTVELPNRGFATAPTLTESSYMVDRQFAYTEQERTFYYVTNRQDETIGGVTLYGDLAGALDYVVSADGRCVTFTVKSGVTEDLWGEIHVDLQGDNGSSFRNGYGFDLLNGAPVVVFRRAGGDRDDPVERQDSFFQSSFSLSPETGLWACFYLRIGGNMAPLQDVTSVISGDESVVSVEYLGMSDLGNPVYQIIGGNYGRTALTVTFDGGKTMTVPVSVVLPSRGFSTSPTLTETSYMVYREFAYTETARTFYYVTNGQDETIESVELEGGLAGALDYVISADGRCVTFTVKADVTEDLRGDIFFQLKYGSGSGSRSGYSFDLINGGNVAVYRWVYGDWDDPQEDMDNETPSKVSLTPGYTHWVVFCLRTGNQVTPLPDVTNVTVDDGSVASVEYLGMSDRGNPVYEVRALGLGSAKLTITYDGGKTLTMPVVVEMPNRGFSTAPSLTEDTLISDREFCYTEQARTFYYVNTRQDETIIKVWMEGQLADTMDYVISADGRCVTFTVKAEVTEDLWGEIYLEIVRANGERYSTGSGFELINGAPRMVFRHVWGDRDDLHEAAEDNHPDSADLSPTWSHWMVFCLREGSSLTPLTGITDVSVADGRVAKVQYMGLSDRGNPVYELVGVNFGTTTLTVTYDGGKKLTMPVKVILPSEGWSNTTTLTEQSFVVEEFMYSKANPTIYFVVNHRLLKEFKLSDWSAQYADCFDISLDPNGRYAAVTVKNGAPLADYWINFEALLEENGGYTHSFGAGLRFINGDAPVLGTPSDLKWHVEYDWNDTEVTRMGSVGFARAAVDQSRYEVEFYRVGEYAPAASGRWGFGSTDTSKHFSIPDFIYADLPSGDYYFRIRAWGDGYNYRNGEWVTSDVWTYVEPKEQLDAPVGLRWAQEDDQIVMKWDDVPDRGRYAVEVFYSETEDGEKDGFSMTFDFHDPRMELREEDIARFGEGWYFFRVRAISGDITQIRNSEWSVYSAGFCLGDVVASVNSALDQIDPSTSTVDDVRDVVSEIPNLDEAMAADTDNDSTAALIEELEKELGVTTSVDTSDAPADFAGADVQIVGAGLNVDTSEGGSEATLTISEVDEDNAPAELNPAQYANTLQFALDIEGARDDDPETPGLQLAVPVKITLPIPGNINPAFLVVLHYKESTGEWEELSWPHVFCDESGRWFATFVVDSMSPFAIVERQSSAAVEGNTVKLDAYLPSVGEGVEFLCALYSKDGKMLDLITLQPHNNEPVAIEVDEISEGMYLKILSVNAGEGWVPVSGVQEIPVN